MLDLEGQSRSGGRRRRREAKLDRGRGMPSQPCWSSAERFAAVTSLWLAISWGRVRALLNEREEQVTEAGPSVPVEILGLDGTPAPGDPFAVVENEARARELTAYRVRVKREKAGAPAQGASLRRDDVEDHRQEGFRVAVGDQGRCAGVRSKPSSARWTRLAPTRFGRADYPVRARRDQRKRRSMLAKGAGSTILGFNVRASKQAQDLAERGRRRNPLLRNHLRPARRHQRCCVLSGMLAPIQRENLPGQRRSRCRLSDISKIGRVAGLVVSPKVRGAQGRPVSGSCGTISWS